MKNITALISGHALNFRAVRFAATTAVLVAAIGAMLPGTANAQKQYIGNAYAVRVDANVLPIIDGGGIGLGVNVNSTGSLNPFTQQTLNGLTGNVSVGTTGLETLPGVFVGGRSLVEANVQTVQTTSVFPATTTLTDTVVQSTSRVTGANILGDAVSNLLGLKITASVIQSQTTAFFSGLTQGSTNILGLNLGSAFLNQDGTAATVNLDAQGNVIGEQTFRVRLIGGTLDVGSLTFNEQILNGDDSRTTNAIHLRLLNNSALGSLANSSIIVASSTAGYAPEPGSLALVAVGLLPAAGLLIRRRRAAKK